MPVTDTKNSMTHHIRKKEEMNFIPQRRKDAERKTNMDFLRLT